MEVSSWIRPSKLTKYLSMSSPSGIDGTAVFALFILSYPNIFCSGNLF